MVESGEEAMEAAFLKVAQAGQIVNFSDYAIAFEAAVNNVQSKKSRDFALRHVQMALVVFCGKGSTAILGASSAWDDWCGENRRQQNAADQTPFFRTVLLSAVKLVLASMQHGSLQLLDSLDIAFDLESPIYSFLRPSNVDGRARALSLREELLQVWHAGNGPLKRLSLADAWEVKPWRSVRSCLQTSEKSIQVEGTASAQASNLVAAIQQFRASYHSVRNERSCNLQRRQLGYTAGFLDLVECLRNESILSDRSEFQRSFLDDHMSISIDEIKKEVTQQKHLFNELQKKTRAIASTTEGKSSRQELESVLIERDAGRVHLCEVLNQAIQKLLKLIESEEVDQAGEALKDVSAVSDFIRRRIIRTNTRRFHLVKSMVQARDGIDHYSKVRAAWMEAGVMLSGMGEKSNHDISFSNCIAIEAIEAYEEWCKVCALDQIAGNTDDAIQMLENTIAQNATALMSVNEESMKAKASSSLLPFEPSNILLFPKPTKREGNGVPGSYDDDTSENLKSADCDNDLTSGSEACVVTNCSQSDNESANELTDEVISERDTAGTNIQNKGLESTSSQSTATSLAENLNSSFGQPSNETSESADRAIQMALERAGTLIDDERSALRKDLISIFPSTILFSAGDYLHGILNSKLEVLNLVHSACSSFMQELKLHQSVLDPEGDLVTRKNEAIIRIKDAQEQYEIANEELEEAILKTKGKRALRRGLDLDELRADVASKRRLAHDAARAVENAIEELTRSSYDFPEVVCHLRAGLPKELMPVWQPSKSLSYFESCSIIETESRHRVYQVSQDGKLYAIKEFMLHDEGSLRTCMREAALLRRLRHPAIAEIISVFEESEPTRHSIFIQMPFYHFGPLDAWIRHHNPKHLAVRRALLDVLMALEHLHDNNVVHCDVKPANILIGAEERARLADFDISVDCNARVSVQYAKRISTYVGFTQGFEAPELFETGSSKATDMYAYGQTIALEVVFNACLEQQSEIDAHDEETAHELKADEIISHDEMSKFDDGLSDRDGQSDLQCLQNLISGLRTAVVRERLTAKEGLSHPFFLSVTSKSHERTHECCIGASEQCVDRNLSMELGIECQEGHFTCRWCLGSYVQEMGASELRQREAREGKIFCPCYPLSCKSAAFTDGALASRLSHKTFERYLASRLELLESQRRLEIEEEMQKQMEAELKRLLMMEEKQRHILAARTYIEEDILQTRCPNPSCRQVYYDFEGCFALRCLRCGVAICAWCGSDCGADAHQHVANCVEKPAGADMFFGTSEQYQRALHDRSVRKLQNFLQTLQPPVAEGVLEALRALLKDRLPGFARMYGL